MSKSVRLNLTLPRSLKERMESIPDPPNWSAVAAAAYEAEVERRLGPIVNGHCARATDRKKRPRPRAVVVVRVGPGVTRVRMRSGLLR